MGRPVFPALLALSLLAACSAIVDPNNAEMPCAMERMC